MITIVMLREHSTNFIVNSDGNNNLNNIILHIRGDFNLLRGAYADNFLSREPTLTNYPSLSIK